MIVRNVKINKAYITLTDSEKDSLLGDDKLRELLTSTYGVDVDIENDFPQNQIILSSEGDLTSAIDALKDMLKFD